MPKGPLNIGSGAEFAVPEPTVDDIPLMIVFNQGSSKEHSLDLPLLNPKADSPDTAVQGTATFTQLADDSPKVIAQIGARVHKHVCTLVPQAERSPDAFTLQFQEESWLALLTAQVLISKPLSFGGTVNIRTLQLFAKHPSNERLDRKSWEQALLNSLCNEMMSMFIVSLVGDFEQPQSLLTAYRALFPDDIPETKLLDPKFRLGSGEALIIPRDPQQECIHVH